MAEKKNILSPRSLTGYQLASNEALNESSVNRVIEHLLKNDDLLKTALDEMGFTHSIQMWTQSSVYEPGDIVVYVQETDASTFAYLLLCLSSQHKKPAYVINGSSVDFSASGWKLIHAATFYLNHDEVLVSNILTPATAAAILSHEESIDYHHAVKIDSLKDFEDIFLLADLSNYTSRRLTKPDGTKEDSFGPGSYAKSDLAGASYAVVGTNRVAELDLDFSFDFKANQDVEILNPRYYYEENAVKDKADSHIFGSFYLEQTQTIRLRNGLVYENIRVPGTNIFSAVIEFPVTFKNTEYMVFPSAYRAGQFVFGATAGELASKTGPGEPIFVSEIMFTNKTQSSITAILPIHCHFGTYGKYSVGVPWVNRFSVHVVGYVG